MSTFWKQNRKPNVPRECDITRELMKKPAHPAASFPKYGAGFRNPVGARIGSDRAHRPQSTISLPPNPFNTIGDA